MIGLLQGQGPAPAGSFDEGTALGNALKAFNDAGYVGKNAEKFDVTDLCFTGTNLLGRYSTGINYEGFGLRGQLRANLGAGFGITARSGAVCYKQVPCFLDLTLSCSTTESFDCNTNKPECEDDERDQAAGFSSEIAKRTRDVLTSPQKRCEIAAQLCVDLGKVSRVAFEDTHVDVHWGGSFALEDDAGDHIVSVIPYVAVGAWIPSGESKNEDILFRLPTGNDGFWGVTAEGILNFDFPHVLTLGCGGAVTYFPKSRTKCMRIPTAGQQTANGPFIPTQQEVLYPWKVNARREMGTTWHVHGDLMAYDFIEHLSFYASYIYSKHQQDDISIQSPGCECFFAPKKLEKETQWESQMLHFALDYRVTKNLYFGFAYQPTLTGRRIYRTSTLIGTIRFYFG